VLIACTAAHRDDGVFDAARYGIDRLKEIVPVWKKESGPAASGGGSDYVPKPANDASQLSQLRPAVPDAGFRIAAPLRRAVR